MSIPITFSAPSLIAAIARMPEPQPRVDHGFACKVDLPAIQDTMPLLGEYLYQMQDQGLA